MYVYIHTIRSRLYVHTLIKCVECTKNQFSSWAPGMSGKKWRVKKKIKWAVPFCEKNDMRFGFFFYLHVYSVRNCWLLCVFFFLFCTFSFRFSTAFFGFILLVDRENFCFILSLSATACVCYATHNDCTLWIYVCEHGNEKLYGFECWWCCSCRVDIYSYDAFEKYFNWKSWKSFRTSTLGISQ